MFPEIIRPGTAPPTPKPGRAAGPAPLWNHRSAAAGRRRADPVGRETLGNRGQGPAVPERFHGRFERRIPLGYKGDESAAEAGFRNGVLTVTLPKTEKAQSQVKRIPIKG